MGFLVHCYVYPCLLKQFTKGLDYVFLVTISFTCLNRKNKLSNLIECWSLLNVLHYYYV